ncbi:hypothetical protein ACFX4W_09530 [Priestia sp. YIM B13489]
MEADSKMALFPLYEQRPYLLQNFLGPHEQRRRNQLSAFHVRYRLIHVVVYEFSLFFQQQLSANPQAANSKGSLTAAAVFVVLP